MNIKTLNNPWKMMSGHEVTCEKYGKVVQRHLDVCPDTGFSLKY